MLECGGSFHLAESESESCFEQPGDNQYDPVHIPFIVMLDILQSYVIFPNYCDGVTANDEFVINFLAGFCSFNEALIRCLTRFNSGGGRSVAVFIHL